MAHFRLLTTVAAAAFTLIGCAAPGAHDHDHEHGDKKEMGMGGMGGMEAMHQHMAGMAVATLTPTQGNSVRGLVMFHEMQGHLMVHAKLSGLKPGAEQGFHLHEKGDCASADGTSAGGHFNPDGKPHGPQDAAHHAGDMPALKADANGVVDQKFMLMGPTVGAGPTSIVGRSVVVHAGPDDYSSQPAGNSGPRVACGVIAAH
jgi:Cu-Zn family superoxide dismutase